MERRRSRTIQHPILIDATASVAPGMEGTRHDLNAPDRDVLGRQGIESAVHMVQVQFFVRLKIGYLSKGMHTRVRSTRANHPCWASHQGGNRCLQDRLNGFATRLNLPPMIMGAVVLEGKLNIHWADTDLMRVTMLSGNSEVVANQYLGDLHRV